MYNEIKLICIRIWDNLSSYPSESIIEKKERLFQTYIILLGLLVSYNQSSSVQKDVMTWFLLFMFFGLGYYVFLARFSHTIPRFGFDIIAVLMGCTFTGAFSVISRAFGAFSVSGESFNLNFFYLFFSLFTSLIAASLFV